MCVWEVGELRQGLKCGQEAARRASSGCANPLATDSPPTLEGARLGLGLGLLRSNRGWRWVPGSHRDVLLERRQRGGANSISPRNSQTEPLLRRMVSALIANSARIDHLTMQSLATQSAGIRELSSLN